MSATKSAVDVLREIDAWLQSNQEARPGWREAISCIISTLEALVRGTVIGVVPPQTLREARLLETRLQETERARLEATDRAERAEQQLADMLARQPAKGRS